MLRGIWGVGSELRAAIDSQRVSADPACRIGGEEGDRTGDVLRLGHALQGLHAERKVAAFVSLVASTRGVALLPAYVEPLLPWSVVSRPLKGEPPTIDLAVGYRSDNSSTVLRTFLSNIDELIAAGPAGLRAKAG